MTPKTKDTLYYYIGIDNGTTGGIATICSDGNTQEMLSSEIITSIVVGKDKFVDAKALYDYITDLCKAKTNKVFAILERGQKQPRFGCKGNFANGENYGIAKAVLYLCADQNSSNFRWIDINPRDWQKVILGSMRGAAQKLDGKHTKLASIEFCKRMYPYIPLIRGKKRTEDDNLADAMCIAHYASMLANNKNVLTEV